MATVIGKIDCPASCGKGQAEVREAKGGTLQIFHSGCCQTFVRSPDSVATLRAKLAGTPPAPAPKSTEEEDDSFSIEKL